VTGALGLVQARMGSTRLPGKSLEPVEGRPLAVLVVERLRRAARVEDVVVATTVEPADDALADAVERAGARVHRGPADDVLTRLTDAAGDHGGPFVRVTADCPFVDPGVVDAAVALFESVPGCAYASNVEPRTYPDGLDVEVVAGWALREAAAQVTDPLDREHVTTAIRRDGSRYPRAVLEQPAPGLAELRWTVDHEEDLEFVRAVARRLGAALATAGMEEVLAAIRREPSLATMHDRWGPRG
jgi:spore coat polysaccharide biosynthesis protein SpsF (cytidylyltransferase family)